MHTRTCEKTLLRNSGKYRTLFGKYALFFRTKKKGIGNMNIIIIGNGIAATSAATAIRQYDLTSSITMLSDENTPFYSRPRLTEYVAGRVSFEKIVIHDEPWYAKHHIRLMKGVKVHSVHPENHEILGTFGALQYDKLLIASGASPAFPGFFVPGMKNVLGLRTKFDADTIIEASKKAKSTMIIGGGLLGIETGYALAERGLSTTIVEFFDRLLPRQLDVECAAILKDMLEKKGLRILLNKKTESLSLQDNLQERTPIVAHFADGEDLAAEIVIISAGVRPNLSFLNGVAIAVGRAITVDQHMQTSIPDIFAAGDSAEFEGRLYGIWPAAKEQGEIAGAAIAGYPVDYHGSIMSTKLKAAGIDVASIGNIVAGPSTLTETKRNEVSYKKFFKENDRLSGAILIGDTSEYFALQKEISRSVSSF